MTKQGDTLTPKQGAFASAVARGSKLVDAYRLAYDSGENASPQSLRNEASRLNKLPKIQARIADLKANKRTAVKDQEALSSQWILSRLRAECLNEENPPSTRVRALEILAKSEGLFSDAQSVSVDVRSSETIEAELKSRLEKLMGNASDIALVK
tara:strand:- start:172 stop:633 length:462 start_codon:yes stop_codon:yes gene_type:complete